MIYSALGNSKWGDIFGLKAEDLSAELLNKIKFEKLLEFLHPNCDPRVSSIISKRILDVNKNSVQYFRYISKDTISQFPKIIDKYNRYLQENKAEIDIGSRYSRDNIIIWDMLNTENKKVEIKRWVNGNTSIFKDDNINYEWLYSEYPEMADAMVEKMWRHEYSYRWNQRGIKHMIGNIPKQHVEKTMKRVFKSNNKELHLAALNNPHLPKKYIISALKIAAKRTYMPETRAIITKGILEDLATITRLEVIEKLVDSRIKIKDIKDKDDFKVLFLGSIMRYPVRVECVVSRFENVKGE